MEWDIAYNTTQDELIISEYGRTVQDLLRNANSIADDEERQRYVERVIKLMLQMQPSIKSQENYEERLWHHAFAIAGEPLNVKLPEGIEPKPEAEDVALEALPYPSNERSRMRHYGQNVQTLIAKGKGMEDGPERDLVTYTAAYYMKIALASWNQGKHVNEEMIRKDLYEMSDRTLVLPPDAKIGEPGPNQPAQHDNKRKKKKKNKKKSRSNNHQHGGSGGGNRSRSRSRGRNRRR